MNADRLYPPILFIHGFGSSGFSGKATVMKRHFKRFFSPTLHPVPALALDTMQHFIHALEEQPLLVGSSLGGYYALYLSSRYGFPAVLINPAITPETTLASMEGMNSNYYDGAKFQWTRAHIDSLRDYHWGRIDQSRLLLLVQMGDELLDHSQTLTAFPLAEKIIEPGGSHEFEGFERMVEPIRVFGSRWVE
ncbi:MAG: YqiA/YcfP family alpha/beta fold hydrolase [Pseudomonadota bacterium]